MQIASGEELFERFASFANLHVERVAEAGSLSEQRPDFLARSPCGTAFYVEVKVVTPTAEEALEIQRWNERGSSSFSTSPGLRMRALISKANSQLKSMAAEELPGVLVVFNPEWHLRAHSSSYSVLTAMRGFDTIPISVPHDPSQSPTFGEMRSGPKKQMTETANTSTSAIICPLQSEAGGWIVQVYHNRFAARPLPVGAMGGNGIKNWRISADEREWEPGDVSAS